jgi:plasmid stabilization system protein ParE
VTIYLVDEARREFLDAISEYEDALAGLGQRFKDEVDRSVLWIADHPELPHLRPGSYRRVKLRVFPYYIAYVIRGQTLWILSIAHAGRKPLYWISRRNHSR